MNSICYSYFIVPDTTISVQGNNIINCISNYEKEIAKDIFKSFWYIKKSKPIGRDLSNQKNIDLCMRILKEGNYSNFEIVDVTYESSMSISNYQITIRRIGNSKYFNIVFETHLKSELEYELIYNYSRNCFVNLSGIYGFINVEEDKVQINSVYSSDLKEDYFLDQIMGIYWKNFLSHGHWVKLNQNRNFNEKLFHELIRLDDSRFVISMGKYPKDFLALLSSGHFFTIRRELSPIEPIGI